MQQFLFPSLDSVLIKERPAKYCHINDDFPFSRKKSNKDDVKVTFLLYLMQYFVAFVTKVK